MSRFDPPPPMSTGQITFGPEDEDGLVPRTLDFICRQLPAWRDDSRRPKAVAEKGLNSSLCDFLDVQQRMTEFAMVRFKHETPQLARTSVDIGVHGLDEVTTIGTHSYGIYEPFMVVECKVLPTPGGKNRQREYVSGFHANGSPTGGIQRFKLGLHGGQVEFAAMIGYVEKHDFNHWRRQINQWIQELSNSSEDSVATWSKSEQLKEILSTKEIACCDSEHSRVGDVVTSVFHLRHVWIDMR